jgi:hypothetical protein
MHWNLIDQKDFNFKVIVATNNCKQLVFSMIPFTQLIITITNLLNRDNACVIPDNN